METIATPSVPTDKLGRNLRDLRISLTDRCNLRCGYCMPADVFTEDYPYLDRSHLLTFEEICVVAQAFAACGGKKLRLTGGEPLLRREAHVLVGMLKAIPGIQEVALTTNGLLLEKHLPALLSAGLDRVTVSLDALNDGIYQEMTGRKAGVGRVLDAITAAEEAGLPVKVNCVVIRGKNEGEVVPLAEYFRGRKAILRYIEYMDVGNCNGWTADEVYGAKEILADLGARWPLEPAGSNYTGEVARRYRYLDGIGEVGIIASVTQPFCRDCNRARLSAEGKLYTCLFASSGTDLRAVLRGGGDAGAILRETWGNRADRYSEVRGDGTSEKIEMSYIGG